MLSRLLTIREQVLLGGFGVALALGAGALVWYHSWGPGAKAAGEWVAQGPEMAAVVEGDSRGMGAASELEITLPQAPATEGQVIPSLPEITVTVRGAVVHEGVLRFSPGARVYDAVESAGGAADGADLSDINLSAKLLDGTTLIIPYTPYGPGPSHPSRFGPVPDASLNPPAYTLSGQGGSAIAGGAGAGGGAATGGARININTASSSTLETLPGIGPSFAQRIIAYREQGPFRSIEELMEVSGIGEKRFAAVQDLVTVE